MSLERRPFSESIIVCGTWTMSRRCRVAERASLVRARRGRVVVAGLMVLLCLASLGFIDPGAIAQEVVGQYRWCMAMDPTVLTVEQEKANTAKLGSDFKPRGVQVSGTNPGLAAEATG